MSKNNTDCPKCGGKGVFVSKDKVARFPCPTCNGTGKKCTCANAPLEKSGTIKDPNCPLHGLTSEENVKRAARKANEDQKAFMDKHAPDRTEQKCECVVKRTGRGPNHEPNCPMRFPIDRTELSNCHSAPVTVGGRGDFNDNDRPVTQYYVCSKCNKPCDLKPADRTEGELEEDMADIVQTPAGKRLGKAEKEFIVKHAIEVAKAHAQSRERTVRKEELERIAKAPRGEAHNRAVRRLAVLKDKGD